MLPILLLTIFSLKVHSKIQIPISEGLLNDLNRSVVISAVLCDKNDAFTITKHFGSSSQINIYKKEVTSLPFPNPSSFQVFLVDLQCPNSAIFLTKAAESSLFAYPFKWIIFPNDTDLNNIISTHFESFEILIDSDVTLAVPLQSGNNYNIVKIYKTHRKSTTFIIEQIGTASGRTLSLNYERIASKRRKNLKQLKLNTSIVITHNDSLNHLTDYRDPHIDPISKVDYVLVEHLKDTINATLNYTIKGTWGYKDNASKWSGMIGQLVRKEADIGGTALFLTSDRISIIDYIAMVTPTRSKFIFRSPKLSYVSNVFTLPFDGYVWASTVLLLAIISVVLYIIVKWEWKRQDLVEHSTEADKLNSWLEVVFIAFGALCQQGSAFTPFSIPGRITTIFLFISYMFLYTSYAANIVALLQSSSNSIKTLEDVLHSRLEIGVDDTVFNHFYFPNATEPTRKAIYEQKVAPPGQKPRFLTTEEGIRRLREGLFAFHVETGPGYKFISEIFHEDEKCGLKEIQYLQVQDPWLSIQKNSSYKKMLKVGLRLLQENGIQNREVGLIYTRKPQCLAVGNSFVSVSLVDCYPAAVVLAGGLITATGILIFELYIARRVTYWKMRIMKHKQAKLHSTHYYE